jgi:hypothetical protein
MWRIFQSSRRLERNIRASARDWERPITGAEVATAADKKVHLNNTLNESLKVTEG